MERKFCIVINLSLLLVIFVSVPSDCYLSNVEKMSRRLDEFLDGVKTPEIMIDRPKIDDEFWQNYEFGTGVANREELLITNITTRIDDELSNLTRNYKFFASENDFFLASSNDHAFYLYKLDLDQDRTVFRTRINLTKKIRNFTVFNVPKSSESGPEVVSTIVIILCVEYQNRTDMMWYRFVGDNLLEFENPWPVAGRVENLQFFHHEGQNRLLLLRDEITISGNVTSMINIYDFNITSKNLHSKTASGLNIPKTFDIHVCPTYESSIIALRHESDVGIYEYKINHDKEFHENQNVVSKNLENLICFVSGSIPYLVTSGSKLALYEFFENEYHRNSHFEDIFNGTDEISWIQNVPVNNYREESILLVQLKNSTVIVLAWKEEGFEKISLPNIELENFDLSSVTIIPKYGFVDGNKFVKIHTKLVDKPRPGSEGMKKLLNTRYALEEVLQKQEFVLNETETRVNKSYFVNPEIKGFWNVSKIEVTSLKIENKVSYDEFTIGTRKMTLDDFLSDQKETKKIFDDLESKIDEIKVNLENSIPKNTQEIVLNDDVFVEGNFEVRGTMFVENLTFDKLNGFSRDEIIEDFNNWDEKLIIEGEKTFESIDAENLNVFFVNDVPVEKIKFNSVKNDYSNVDFSKLTNLMIEGNLNFEIINNVTWTELINKVVFKSQSTNISGITMIEGDLIADNINIERLNGLVYPEEYISSNSGEIVVVRGKKKFQNLTIDNLDFDAIKTINGVSIDQYVTLNGDKTINEEVTFNNIKITNTLRIDGKVTGLSDDQRNARLTLNETTNVISDVVFHNLRVTGDFEIENSLNGTTWAELDDLVTIDNEIVEITGEKIFLSPVDVDAELTNEKQIINGHLIEEFLTLDTDQELPNLEKISGNVTFTNVKREDMEFLRKILTKNSNNFANQTCLTKMVIFNFPPIVEQLLFERINGNVTAAEFSEAAYRTFSNVNFQNLEVTNLRAREIAPINVNDENYEHLKNTRISKTMPQVLTGNYEIDILETNFLNVRTIDGRPTSELEILRIRFDDFYDRITNGSLTIDSLEVKGDISATSVNGKLLKNLYRSDTMGTVIFRNDVFVENLVVYGFINGINFTEFVEDSVMKGERDIVITGKKNFNKINCESLQATSINGKLVDHILDPDKHQIIRGSVKVNGTVTVVDRFETDGKIGEISWQRIRDRFEYMGNDTYKLNGDVVFTSEDVMIENLIVTDSIQNINFNDFLESIVYIKSKNVTINGPVVFKNPITIDGSLTITESWNDLNLKYFYDHAVRIDRPLSVKSKIVFTQNINIEEDLLVDEALEAKTIGGFDLKELYESTIFVNRPTYIPGSVTLNNVIFESNVVVESINDIDLSTVITLAGEQTFSGTLRCSNITIGKLDIGGKVNGHNLSDIYDNSFMLTGNQSISNHIVFDGNVNVRRNFDATLINGVDPKKMISLDGNDTLIGNFIFEQPLVVHGNVRANGTINDIDMMMWRATVVSKSFPIRQIVKGDWKIRGNVHFEKNIYGNDFLNGVNVTEFANDLYKRDKVMESKTAVVKKNSESFCEDLTILKNAADNQVYKYKFFDYLDVLTFNQTIVSVHQYESDNFDYLLVNFATCQLDIFVFNGTVFERIASLSNVGYIERWYTLLYRHEIYFLTVGKYACDKSMGNVWKVHNDEFVHYYHLGNVTDVKKIKDDEFLTIIDGKVEHRSMLEIDQRPLTVPRSYAIGKENFKFVVDSSELLILNRDTLYECKIDNGTEYRRLFNSFGTSDILSSPLGIYRRETFFYYDDDISEEYIFVSDSNFRHHKILQTIKAQKPSSIIVLNFDGFIENFLIFIENHEILQIYEYRGIEGFVYRESIKIKADKIVKFKIRRYSKIVKKHCIAVIQDKRLVIMEAKMYGEKLDMGTINCD